MKRSDFFKSLLGLAIAPAAAKWIGRDEMLKQYEAAPSLTDKIKAQKAAIYRHQRNLGNYKSISLREGKDLTLAVAMALVLAMVVYWVMAM